MLMSQTGEGIAVGSSRSDLGAVGWHGQYGPSYWALAATF